MDEATAASGAEQDGLTPVKPPEAELLVVTGMSGAGRSTASDALEDHGWYVVDNLPPQMLGTLAEIVSHAPKSIPKLAVVVDVRSKDLFTDIQTALGALSATGITFRVLFLDASDDVLVRRFEQGRRPHPLQGGGRILDGIGIEREVLRELREHADVVLDTTEFNVHGLATAITQLFSDTGPVTLRLNVMSFGFKYGLPVDANFVADARSFPTPTGSRSSGRTRDWTRTSATTCSRPMASTNSLTVTSAPWNLSWTAIARRTSTMPPLPWDALAGSTVRWRSPSNFPNDWRNIRALP